MLFADLISFDQYAYEYDGANNRSAMSISTPGSPDMNINYEYDRANRMIEESYQLIGNASSDTTYQYDRAGNRTQMRNSSGDITRYKYDDNDQIERIDLPDYYFEEYLYDARGNLTSIQLKRDGITPVALGNPTLFEYNSRDLLSRIELPGTERIDYEYDYRGNRVRQEQVGFQDPTLYLWDEFSQWGDVILETGVNFGDSSLYHKMDYTLAGGMLISQTDYLDITSYFLSDAQGTTRVMTDDTGAISSEYDYDAFGNLDESIDPLSTETAYLYAGQQFDGYSELYSMRARYYDPTQGRFMTRDTYAYNYQNPFELNRYTYGANNPATFTDPSGNFVGMALAVLGFIRSQATGGSVGAMNGMVTGAAVSGIAASLIYANASYSNCGQKMLEMSQGVSAFEFVGTAMAVGAVMGGLVGAFPALEGVAFGAGVFFSGLAFASDPNFCSLAMFIMSFAAGGAKGNTLSNGPATVTVQGNMAAMSYARATSGLAVTVGEISAGLVGAVTGNWLFSSSDDTNDNQQNQSNSPDLSKSASRLRRIFRNRPSTSGQCDACANETGRAILDEYPDYNVDIIKIQNQATTTGQRGASLNAINAEGEVFYISQDPQGLQPFHEATRITTEEGAYIIDALVFEHQGVNAMPIGDYMTNLWEFPFPEIHISGTRIVP